MENPPPKLIRNFVDHPDDIHTMPSGLPEHLTSKDCWCEPEVYFVSDSGGKAWLHKEIQ